MSGQAILLEGFTASDRHAVVARVERAVTEAGGWIDDATLFSNISAALRCVVPRG